MYFLLTAGLGLSEAWKVNRRAFIHHCVGGGVGVVVM